jgi:outer membrane protein assembly factor BamB
MTLPVDGQVAKTLFTVDEYLSEKRYEELTELLLNLAEAHGRELVAVPTEANAAVHRYVNVAAHCQRILASLPPAGRAVCRKLLDPPAKRWYEAWQSSRDEEHLLRILRSAYISSFGDNALWDLGQSAWDRGDSSLAAAYWSQLDHTGADSGSDGLAHPDPEYAAAEVQARLILCEVFSQRFAEAEQKLIVYRERFPEAQGTLAGRQGKWSDLLQQALVQAKTWKSRDADHWVGTFGGANERQRNWAAELDLGPLRWMKSWPVRLLPQTFGMHPHDRGPLKSFPVVDHQHVFVSDGDMIRAWNVVTGEPAWPNDQPDPSVIYPPVPQEMVSLPFRPCVGVPWQTLTLHQGKLYARMGSPLAGATASERGDLVSELVCLDVRTGQGKLVWKLSADDLPANGPPRSFEGTPLIVGGTAYAALYRRQPEAEFALVAIDSASGQVRWLRLIGSARPSVDDAVNRVSHLLLTSGDGRLYLSTDQGTMLALAPEDGRLLWAVSYESQTPDMQQGHPLHLQSGLLPPVFSQGLLFVAPNDSRFLFCLEAASGRIVWQRRAPERLRTLIGVTIGPRRGRLIASGNSLWAFDVQDGLLAGRMSQHEPDERGYGQGILTGKSIFWPTREWLFQLNQTTFEVERKIPLHTPDSQRSGGNLAVADGMLLVVEPDRIAAYGEYSLLKERLEIELSRRPDDAAPWQRLMDLEASASQWESAVSAGRKAWELRGPLSAAELAALQSRWTAVLGKQLARKTDAEDFSAVDELFEELSEIPLSTDERGRLLWDWAHLDLKRDQPARAVARLHQLLALHLQSRMELNGRQANLLVRQELDRIWQESGRDAFREVHQRAEQKLAASLAAGNVNDVRQVLRHYPLLESAAEVWPRLIAENIRRKKWSAVWPLFDEWQTTTESDRDRSAIRERKIAALQQAGYARAAASLEKPPTLALEEAVEPPAPWHYAARSWQIDVPSDHRALIPCGTPPGEHLACAVIAGTDIAALDRITGNIRWGQTSDSMAIWAGYGETNLLLASKDSLSARSLETGEPLWHWHWNHSDRMEAARPGWLQLTADRLMIFDPGRGVMALSASTGDMAWEFRLPNSATQRLQPWWLCQDDWVLLQSSDGGGRHATNGRLEAATGRLIRSGSLKDQTWRRRPVDLGSELFGVVTYDRRVLGVGLDLTERWKYSGAMSHAHADPWIIRDGELVGLLVDGATLVGLEAETGARRWSTGLADFPVTDFSKQVAHCQGIAAAAWPTMIRGVDLTNGKIAWEARLPDGVLEWTVSVWHGQFAVTGTATSPTAHALLFLFDAATGQCRQMLRQECAVSGGNWHLDDHGVLFVSSESISAWQPLTEKSPDTSAGVRR